MAEVASCPQCNHELLVPSEADQQAWANCPRCRASFQLSQIALREIPELVLVEPPSQIARSEPPMPDLTSSAASGNPLKDAAATTDAATERSPPQINADLRDTAERIDTWFRSAQKLPESPPIPATASRAEAGDDVPPDAEADSDTPAEIRPSVAPWDDSLRMEQLLADIEIPRAPVPIEGEAPAAKEHPRDFVETIAATSASDVPIFAKPAPGRPRRRRSPLRTLTVTAAAGMVGLALGYYALLWLRGPDGDFLDLARYLPAVVLPTELQAEQKSLATAAPPSSTQPATGEIENTSAKSANDSAEMQASFTSAVEPGQATPQTDGDRYGIDDADDAQSVARSAAFEEPTVIPLAKKAAPAKTITVKGAPTFTADELAAAVRVASEAQPSLVTGRLQDGREVQRAKGYGYSMLADLAQKATFVDASTDSESVDTSQQAAAALFQQTLSDANTRSEVAVIVPKWIDSPHRKHGGVFFAASLSDPRQAGEIIECGAELPSGESLTLLVPAAVADRLEVSSQPLGIVGWIVEQPVIQVDGYTGQSQLAVWVSQLIPLE